MKKQTTFNLITNGRQKQFDKNEISYEEIVKLTYPLHEALSKHTAFSVSYSRGKAGKERGILHFGDSVPVKEGMIFNVYMTDKS